jgi:rRNA maturation RNase YbeY
MNAGEFRKHDVGVTLVNSVRMRSLNLFYRKRPRATDVLSFRVADEVPGTGSEMQGIAALLQGSPGNATYIDAFPEDRADDGQLSGPPIVRDLGDIVICLDFCARYASVNGWPLADYLPLVAVHGIAHLAGHTHNAREDYTRMKLAEAEAMARLRSFEGGRVRGLFSDGSLGEVRHCKPPSDLPTSYLP